MAIRLEAIPLRLEAIALRLEAIALRLGSIASRTRRLKDQRGVCLIPDRFLSLLYIRFLHSQNRQIVL